MPLSSPINLNKFIFDVHRDTIDFRDKMYEPTLVEVPPIIELETYKKAKVPILNQGNEGACTGFGLATVVHFLLRTRQTEPNLDPVSPRMLYEMAKRYDEFPGEKYSGSSARGAMKGWHKHGVCSETIWPYRPGQVDRTLTNVRAIEARNRPLGAYFRVNHKDLVAMHSAIAEVKILYATANVHEGWNKIDDNGWIPYRPELKILGGHAFAIVAYDREGFWIQNSWSSGWGLGGYAKILYDDWLANGMDVWVARLGVPIIRLNEESTASSRAPGAERSIAYTYSDLRPHVISLENDGKLKEGGTYGADRNGLEKIILEDIPRLTEGWDKRRIFLYAHGGLVGETGFIQRVAEYRSAFLKVNVFPLAFVWHTDLWSTVTDILQDAAKQRRPEGILDDALDFMLDRLDETLEVIVRTLRVKGLWDEMKENAHLATSNQDGGARLALKLLAELMEKEKNVEIHLAGHSAGSIFHAYLLQYLTTRGKIKSGPMKGEEGLGKKVTSCTLWAPGIRILEFKETYLPAIRSRQIERFSLYTLKDDVEQDDQCANIYHKSLLYLVSNALESKIGEEILGMEKFVKKDEDLEALFKSKNTNMQWVKAPNYSRLQGASKARHHGDFDDDKPTLMSTLVTILNSEEDVKPDLFEFKRSSSSLGDRRRQLG